MESDGYVWRNFDWCDYPDPKAATVSAGSVAFLGATAHVPGANGTNWRSAVEVHSFGVETAVFVVSLLEHGRDNSSPQWRELTLAPGESLRLEDVLAREFSFEGQAALAVSTRTGRIALTSRTYNLLGAGNDLGLPEGSTFGQYIPAWPQNEAIGPGDEGRIVQLSHSRSSTDGFRTNLALVNAGMPECRVETDLYTANGMYLGQLVTNLGPLEYRQINKVFERVTGSDVEDGYAVVRTPSESGRFFAFASVVDNLTGDPIAIGAVRTADVVATDAIYVQAAAHVGGAAGTNWRTDVEVHNPEAGVSVCRIDLLAHGADNSQPASRTYTLGAGRSLRFEDVLDEVFGVGGQAALRFEATSGRVIVTSRTYNLLEAGNDLGLPAGATFGQFIPGTPASQAIGFGAEGRLIQLSHNPAGRGFRTNLVLVNATGQSTEVEVELFDADSRSFGAVTLTMAPFEYRQVNRVFEQVTDAPVEDGYAVVRTTTQGGRFFALASVVDNLTGDPVGMTATEILTEEAEAVVGEVDAALGGLAGTGIEVLVGGLQDLGVATLLDLLVAMDSDVMSRTGQGVVFDFGEGVTQPDGSFVQGSAEVDASGLVVTQQEVSGVISIDVHDLLVDGEPPVIGSTDMLFDLGERNDGTVHGTVSVGPAGGGKQSGSVVGHITIDTAICPDFPIDGSVTIDFGNLILTINFSPDCDGGFAHDITPGRVFSYSYGNPASNQAQAYIVSSHGAEAVSEGTVWYWRPTIGAETPEDAPPGVITYHFPLDGVVAGGRLRAGLACWHWTYSQGQAALYGSTDGASWQLLDAIAAPAEVGQASTGGWNGELPGFFLGASDIWLRVELRSFGDRAQNGGIFVNTAQHSRWAEGSSGSTFELEVTLSAAPRGPQNTSG